MLSLSPLDHRPAAIDVVVDGRAGQEDQQGGAQLAGRSRKETAREEEE